MQNIILWKTVTIICLVLAFLIFLKLSSLKVKGRNLITLRTRIFLALMFPLILILIVFFASLLLIFILGVLVVVFILFLILLFTGKTKIYYKKL